MWALLTSSWRFNRPLNLSIKPDFSSPYIKRQV
jgi:hypothetical protein